MSKLAAYTDQHYTPLPYLHLSKYWNGDAAWVTGTWRGSEGLVQVTVTRGNRPSLLLEILVAGRVHLRRWDHQFGKRTISRLAREFAIEMGAGA